MLRDSVEPEILQPSIDVTTAILVVAQVFEVSPAALLRPTRGRASVALARQTAMYLAHVTAGLSLTTVGCCFKRDRTTVAHACRLIEMRRDDPGFDRVVELLEWSLPVFARRQSSSLSIQL